MKNNIVTLFLMLQLFAFVISNDCVAQGKVATQEPTKGRPNVAAPVARPEIPGRPTMSDRTFPRRPMIADRAGKDCKTPVWEWRFVGTCCDERQGPMCLECKPSVAGLKVEKEHPCDNNKFPEIYKIEEQNGRKSGYQCVSRCRREEGPARPGKWKPATCADMQNCKYLQPVVDQPCNGEDDGIYEVKEGNVKTAYRCMSNRKWAVYGVCGKDLECKQSETPKANGQCNVNKYRGVFSDSTANSAPFVCVAEEQKE